MPFKWQSMNSNCQVVCCCHKCYSSTYFLSVLLLFLLEENLLCAFKFILSTNMWNLWCSKFTESNKIQFEILRRRRRKETCIRLGKCLSFQNFNLVIISILFVVSFVHLLVPKPLSLLVCAFGFCVAHRIGYLLMWFLYKGGVLSYTSNFPKSKRDQSLNSQIFFI